MKFQRPLTVLFRPDIYGTATLVGLVNMRAPISKIVLIGDATPLVAGYCERISTWLEDRGYPGVTRQDGLEPELVMTDPLRTWNWRHEECRAAIKLAGLPPPPN